MPRLQQGSVLWARLPSPFGRRPVVALTRDEMIGRLNAITVAPITRTIRNLPTEVVLQPIDGVPEISVVSLDNIVTIQRHTLEGGITILTHEKMQQIFQAIRIAFDMP